MNGQEFYDLFKEALSALGVMWNYKHEAQVSFKEGKMVLIKEENGLKVIVEITLP